MLVVSADGGTSVALATSENGGLSFDRPVPLDESGRVLTHVSPLWSDDGLHWARLNDGGQVELCLWDGENTACSDTGADRIDGLTHTGAALWASLPDEGGQWTVTEIQ